LAKNGRQRTSTRIERTQMAIKGQSYQDRQTAAAEAKKAILAKFMARPGPDDPAVAEREAKRREIIEARRIREAEREAKRLADEAAAAERRAAEEKAREEARLAEEAAREAARIAAIEAKAALEAQQKAERDARYAARKARKVQRKTEIQRYR
jgi:hypothetical protein